MPIRLARRAAAPKYRFANEWLTITTGWLPSRSPAVKSRPATRCEPSVAEYAGVTAARGASGGWVSVLYSLPSSRKRPPRPRGGARRGKVPRRPGAQVHVGAVFLVLFLLAPEPEALAPRAGYR